MNIGFGNCIRDNGDSWANLKKIRGINAGELPPPTFVGICPPGGDKDISIFFNSNQNKTDKPEFDLRKAIMM